MSRPNPISEEGGAKGRDLMPGSEVEATRLDDADLDRESDGAWEKTGQLALVQRS